MFFIVSIYPLPPADGSFISCEGLFRSQGPCCCFQVDCEYSGDTFMGALATHLSKSAEVGWKTVWLCVSCTSCC